MRHHSEAATPRTPPFRIAQALRRDVPRVPTRVSSGIASPLGSSATRWVGLVVLVLACIISLTLATACHAAEPLASADFERDRIQPYVANPFYWQYRGEPLLLIGGTHDDNPFNSPSNDPTGGNERLEDHLDLLASVGGNYLRNTMTHRGIFNVYPYLREPDILHDALDDPSAWTSIFGSHALDTATTLEGTGSLSVWNHVGESDRHLLRRELAATDFTHGTIEAWFWVRDADAARKLEHLEVKLEANGYAVSRVWPGQIMSGWHLLVFHVEEFVADGFDISAVDALELRVGTVDGVALERGEVAWDGIAVRGRFDLDQPNPEYWWRFETFLDAALARGMIVQVELWDKVDMFWDGGTSADIRWLPRMGWSKHPFNPRNNVNFTAATSGLKEVIDWSYNPAGGRPRGDTDVETIHPFWYTVPSVAELLPGGARAIPGFELTEGLHERLVEVVLPHQVAFVDRVLEISLDYPNVLYVVNNETWLPTSDWSDFWAAHLRKRAAEAGRGIEVGDMRGEHDLREAPPHAHLHVVRNPDLYSFIDISQNSGRKFGDEQWSDLQWVRAALVDVGVRPVNNVKIYDFVPRGESAGRVDFSIQKFWRSILGGAASSRFHRRLGAALHRSYDSDGQPITNESNEPGLASFRSAVMFVEAMDVFRAEPANALLQDRGDHEAYAMAIEGERYAVYFPAGGSVDLMVAHGSYEGRWLDIGASAWSEIIRYEPSDRISLSAPVAPHALVVLERFGD